MAADLIGTTEAARILGKTDRTIQRWVLTGRLAPVVTMPGRSGAHLFDRADVEAILEEAA